MPAAADWSEWFKDGRLVLRLYNTDEVKIQKTNRAHLIKSLLCGNYLMKTFASERLGFQQSRNWQKESCLFSYRLEQRTEQTADNSEGGGGVEKWALDLQLVRGNVHTAAQSSQIKAP